MTDDMVDLARGLKQQALNTADIISSDMDVLDEANQAAAENQESLSKANEELRRQV